MQLRFARESKSGEVKLNSNRVLGWQRKLRIAFVVIIALAVIWLFVQVGKYTISSENDAMKGTYAPGITVFYDRFFDWHDGVVPFVGVKNRGVLRGNIVLFLKEGLEVTDPATGKKSKGDYYGISRVIGLPGDQMKYVPNGVVIRQKDGKEQLFAAPHNQSTTELEEIPPDRFYVLNDNEESAIQDSRQFGYLLGSELRGKVMGPLNLW
jgi:signal peptidase I